MKAAPASNTPAIAATISVELLLNGIPIEHLQPLLGEEPKGDLPSCVSVITRRVIAGEIDPTFAENYTRRLVEQTQARRGCQDRVGTDELLKLLLESCPREVKGGEKLLVIQRVLNAYQGPCCGNSPCTRGNP